ncbi:hypothetical protein BRC90_00925 [Halobacteriales archaeon QS_4_69_34]|nr:MAG: hypothetical protein BRC90_00925 [Halobacteriales archaeon QS_4_69_34]
MSIAAETRRAVRRRPFVHRALRAGVLNYAAAARMLDIGETEAVTAALRRYAAELPAHETAEREARVTMRSGLGIVGIDDRDEGQGMDESERAASGSSDPLLAVGGTAIVPDGGSLTGVLATGAVDARALAHALDRLAVEECEVVAAGVAGGTLLVVVARRDGPDAVRVVEDALEAVPRPASTCSTD